MEMTRRTLAAGLAAGAATLLSSCGTILYPDRSQQKERGQLDPAIIILDGIGLFFFLIPGLVAFAVDFTTGAIYFPAGHEPGDRERTIFDRVDARTNPGRREIEQAVAQRTGRAVDLGRADVRVAELESLDHFWLAHAACADRPQLAAR